MELRYPLAVFNDRDLPRDYAGPVFVWDVDKTYLSTRFSSSSGLARIPIEFSVDKVAIPANLKDVIKEKPVAKKRPSRTTGAKKSAVTTDEV